MMQWCCSTVIAIAMTAVFGCATAPLPMFREIHRIETQLQQGISTKADVERILGKANGLGQAFLPMDTHPRDIWYYEDIVITGVSRVEPGEVHQELRQQFLIIAFDGELFEGFFWFSNAVNVTPANPLGGETR